jgi:hypothetical protein
MSTAKGKVVDAADHQIKTQLYGLRALFLPSGVCSRRYEKGARIILNGWTAGHTATTYGPLDAEVDAFAVRYPDALIISGAGNHGALT